MTAPVVFVDTETTGLDPERHEIWDIGLIEADGTEHEWHVRPQHPERADPTALRLMDFYGRTAADDWRWGGPDIAVGVSLLTGGSDADRAKNIRYQIASQVALLTAGKHLVGAVPSFDAAFLSAFLIGSGQREAWHYHLIDVETLIAGRCRLEPPYDSEELSRAVGIEPDRFARHTAIGDARWAKAMYEAVLTFTPEEAVA